jgi:DNA-binding HxlR family transcriptional regulator
MSHTSFEAMQCPTARGLKRVGERWSVLIRRDAFLGSTRFHPIASTSLTRRLNALVEAETLERHRHSQRPRRDEYRLTGRARDFRPVHGSLLARRAARVRHGVAVRRAN